MHLVLLACKFNVGALHITHYCRKCVIKKKNQQGKTSKNTEDSVMKNRLSFEIFEFVKYR